MRFSLPRKDLQRMIAVASKGAADDKSPVPALSHIHITVRNQRVRCEATSIYSAVSIEGGVSLEGSRPYDPGEILAPKDLLARVSAMPDGLVEIRLEGTQIIVTSPIAPRRFQLSGLAADTWVNNMRFPEGSGMTVPAATLLKLLTAVEHAISTDETRAHVNSTLLIWNAGEMTAVATDGYRLTYVTLPMEGVTPSPTLGKNEMLVRRNDVRLFRGLLDQALREERKEVVLHASSGTMGLTIGEIQAMVKLTDGVFPPWRQVVPAEWKRRFLVKRAPLLDTIAAVMLTDKETMLLEVKAGGSSLAVTSGNVKSGDAGDALDIFGATVDKGVKTECSLKVSPKYAREALDAFDTEDVLLCVVGDGREELMFVRGDEKGALPSSASQLSLIMPMKD